MGLLDNFEHDQELKDLIKDKIRENPSFKNVFTRNLTTQINNNLKQRTQGQRTGHFVIFISGVPSITTTGSFKSGTAQVIAQTHDKNFNAEKITFTNDQLLDVMKEQGIIGTTGNEISQTFIRDESIRTLKARANIEFSVVVETLRDSRINLIVVKPQGEPPDVAHYHLESFLFNPKQKIVRLAVYNHANNHYRGYYEIKLNWNNKIWKEYMKKKKQFQQMVVDRKTTAFNEKKYAEQFLKKHRKDLFYTYAKNGSIKLEQQKLKRYLQKEYPQLTNDERNYIKDFLKEKILGE